MKKIYGNDPRSELTMTVKELRDELSKYPEDMPVIATWEGVLAGITQDGFSIFNPNVNITERQLHIDVEYYG